MGRGLGGGGGHIREWEMLGMMGMKLTTLFYTVEVPVERMEDVGDDGHETYNIILYCRVPSVVGGRCRCWYATRGEGVDFLVACPRSAVIIVERLKFLYEVL